MARTRVWRKGVLEAEDFPVGDISEFLGEEDCLVWADLCVPDHSDPGEELQLLADELGLAPLAVEDAIEHHERPKVDRYPTHVFLTTYGLSLPPGQGLRMAKVSAFLLPQALVTVRREDFDIAPVLRAWDDDPGVVLLGSRGLLHGLLDVVVDGHLAVLQQLDDEVEDAEDQLFDDRARARGDLQRQTYELRRKMTGVRKVVLPMRDVAEVLARHHEPAHPAELAERWRDLRDHVIRANEWNESLRDVVTSMFEVGLSLADARLNQVVRKLSGWAAIIAVPTAVTGFYGQNVPYPGYGQWTGFVSSTLVTLLLAVGFYAMFKKRGWL